MEGRLTSLALLWSLLLTGANAVTVTIPQANYEVARGDNITIPCSFSAIDQTKLVFMQWTIRSDGANAEENEVVTYYPDGSNDVPPPFTGRVTVNVDVPNGKFNLNLFSVAMTDQGTYKCHLQVKSDTSKSAASTYVLVLVAPSIPLCSLQGKAEYGQNISLTCSSTEGSPTPTYTWQSLDTQNNPRPMDPKTTSNAGVLSLFNVSKDTSGYYICTSANKIRSAKCNFTLAVMPPSMNMGATAGIVAGVAIFVLVIGIIICCCCCRKKDKDDGYEMGAREDQEYHDKDLAKNGDGRYADGHEEVRTTENTYVKSAADHLDDRDYENQSERGNDRRSDYDDRRSDYDDRRSDYDDRRRDHDDRRSDHNDRRDRDDRRSDYDDRRSDYDDRRSDYSDRRDKYSDRQERYDDNRRYDDDRRYNDRRDRRYDDQH